MIGKISIFILLTIIAVSIFIVQKEIDSKRGELSRIEEFTYLPKGEYLRPFTMGYEQLTADILWLQAIQYIGEKKQTTTGFKWLYHVLDIVTTLDPKFEYVYLFGGLALTLDLKAGTITESNLLLEKGIKNNPIAWQIPFYLGFNHFYYLDDPVKAAHYIEKASLLQGSPPYLPKLAARMYAEAENPETAISFLSKIYESAQDERIKEDLLERIKELIVERDIIFLERAVAEYNKIYRRQPTNLNDLIEGKILNQLPLEPFKGHYYIDEKTKEIKSSTKRERLKVYNRGKLKDVVKK